jgi:hypothetical protein
MRNFMTCPPLNAVVMGTEAGRVYNISGGQDECLYNLGVKASRRQQGRPRLCPEDNIKLWGVMDWIDLA